jgi:peptide chain release factor subunit 1
MPIERDLHASVAALAAIAPGPHWVVSCYLKLEPRDKTRGKYLIKMKNRVRDTVTALARRPLERADREAIAADLGRVLEYFDDPGRLPSTRGIAIFASQGLRLFEALALPHVHRSRLGVDRVPLVRELVALEEEFGTILVAACDRTAARFFEVTAFDCVELTALAGIDASRGGRFHAGASESAGERNYHTRIRAEKQRLYADVADRIFQIHSQRPLTGLVVAGLGVDAGAVVPHLHTYLHDLVLGVVKLNPKQATAAEVREATLALREERERAWERAHADAAKEGVATGWAVNGIDATRKALARGQVRTLLADGQDADPRIDDAVEEALRERAQVDVLYDDKARRVVDGLAALLRFRA